MAAVLEIRDLHSSVAGKEILKGVSLTIKQGEIHAMMGPNGSGKSTLAYTVMGHPNYTITSGDILYNGESILEWKADERARAGIFLAFQYPTSIPGVSMANFLRTAVSAMRGFTAKPAILPDGRPAPVGSNLMPMRDFRRELTEKMNMLGIPGDFARRYLNEGFSGGEKKRAEILQMALLQPKIAIMDETDSGLDIDALRTVAEGVNRLIEQPNGFGALVITHYQRLLNYIKPQHVHVFYKGRIVQSGGAELALTLEEKGYDWVKDQYGSADDVLEEEHTPALIGALSH